MACSNCGQGDGHHDSMHCPYTAIKLFGVRITNAPSIPKSASIGYLPHLGRNSFNAGVLMENTPVRKSASAENLLHLSRGHDGGGNPGKYELDGYKSDGLLQTRRIICSSTSHAPGIMPFITIYALSTFMYLILSTVWIATYNLSIIILCHIVI